AHLGGNTEDLVCSGRNSREQREGFRCVARGEQTIGTPEKRISQGFIQSARGRRDSKLQNPNGGGRGNFTQSCSGGNDSLLIAQSRGCAFQGPKLAKRRYGLRFPAHSQGIAAGQAGAARGALQ